jgi:hypothetical protein
MSGFKRLLSRSIKGLASSQEFEALVADSEDYLSRNLMIHQQTWQFGSESGVRFDPQTGVLSLAFSDGREVHCPAQAVGSLDTQAGTWAWANPSIYEELRREVETVKAYGARHGFARLTHASWESTTEQAWQMTAVAAKLCIRPGAYAMSTGSLQVFLMFRDVHLERFEIGS